MVPQISVKSYDVDFVSPVQMLKKVPELRGYRQIQQEILDSQDPALQVLPHINLHPNPNARFIGRQVTVVGQSAFKGYEGTIRATAGASSNNVIVYMPANNRVEEMSLTSLASLYVFYNS